VRELLQKEARAALNPALPRTVYPLYSRSSEAHLIGGTMKTLTLAVASLCAAAAPAAFAQDYRYRDDYRNERRDTTARVIESRPVYEAANSREECWNPSARRFEERRDEGGGLGKGAAIGAVAGGVLGHQIDHGAGTAIGAILGGLAGNQIEKDRRDDNADLDLSRCRMVSEGDRNLQGYDVRYSYQGNEYTTRLAQDPGRRLRVGEQIRDDGTPFDSVASYSTPSYGYTDPRWR
jgi:uncharacterized protein YcfJ